MQCNSDGRLWLSDSLQGHLASQLSKSTSSLLWDASGHRAGAGNTVEAFESLRSTPALSSHDAMRLTSFQVDFLNHLCLCITNYWTISTIFLFLTLSTLMDLPSKWALVSLWAMNRSSVPTLVLRGFYQVCQVLRALRESSKSAELLVRAVGTTSHWKLSSRFSWFLIPLARNWPSG